MYMHDNVSQLIDDFDYSTHETPAGELKLRLDKSSDDTERKILRTEIDSLNFLLVDGQVKPLASTTDESGLSIKEYPSLKDFDDESLAYLQERAKSTSNDRVKARYNQILSSSRLKEKGLNRKAAVDAYLKLIGEGIKSNDFNNIYEDVTNAMHLSHSTDYRKTEVNKIVMTLIENDLLPYNHFVILVPRALKIKSFLSSTDLVRLARKGEKIWKAGEKHGLFAYHRIVDVSTSISQRLKRGVKKWQSRLGSLYEQAIDSRKDDTFGMLAIDFCEKAITHYRNSGNKVKVTALLKRLVKLRANLKLSTVEITIPADDLKGLYEYHKKYVSNLLKNTPDEIFAFLAGAPNVLPDLKSVQASVKARERSFMDGINVIKFDINKNPRNKGSHAKAEVDFDAIMEDYSWYVRLGTYHLLTEIFTQGLYKRKVNSRNMVLYLHKNSWLGKNITYKNSAGEGRNHNWLAMISHALLEFFAHWESLKMGSDRFQNFIMATDSLAMKFEGILRDFGKVIGAETIRNSKGRLREAYIEELLSDPKLIKFLHEDDLLFFKYLFTSKGIDVRNNVAHSFYKFHQYKPERVILLIVAILRIGKYQVNVDRLVL